MESQIEKMYENAGVDYEERYNNCTLNKEGECKLKCSCDICKYSEEKYIYPLFTAEKQILLIQWLLDRTDLYFHRHKTDFTYSIASGSYAVNKYKDFKESIAEFINAIWQDLTEEEKQQVKGILERR